ncbi:hypothetical protein BH11GEM1_BH11GEM1_01610 [soil metagenome]
MKTRNFVLSALGLAAAFTFGGAETASAQAKSQTRIPVRKDAQPMEMAKPDTVYIRTKPDTVMMMGRTDTVTVRMRPDTVMQMQMLPIQRLPGVYFGLGGGIAVPMNDWRNSTKDGPAVQGQLGWYPKDGALGIRIDGLANFFGHRSTNCNQCPSPRLYEGNADLTLRFPLDRTSHLNPVVYIMGGGGLDKFTDFLPYVNTEGKVVTAGGDTYLTYPGLPLSTTSTAANFRGDKTLFYNYNAGAGLDWTAFDLHWYVESKYTVINTTKGNSHYWPITVGLKFY